MKFSWFARGPPVRWWQEEYEGSAMYLVGHGATQTQWPFLSLFPTCSRRSYL
jgi:hypothetical protein